MNSAASQTQSLPPVRVSGVDYLISMSQLPDGRTFWSTPTRHGTAQGISKSPLEALRAARDWLQCAPWHHREPELGDGELETLLEGSVTLAKGGVGRFGRRSA